MRKILTLLLILTMCALPAPALADSITVAAGAGYKKMVNDLAEAFTAESGITVERIYGNMGQTIAQAKNSGLVDCIIGAKRFLNKSGIDFTAMNEVGRGKLVAALAKGVDINKPEEITLDSITRVAMPDPKKAIYGKAATEYLKNAGLAEKVKDKVLVVATVPQVSSYVLSKEVDVGFINLTDAIGIKDKIGPVLPVDESLYSPIIITAAFLKTAPNAPTLARFAEFLKGAKAKEIARKHGL